MDKAEVEKSFAGTPPPTTVTRCVTQRSGIPWTAVRTLPTADVPGMSAQKIRADLGLALKQMTARGWDGDLCLIRPDETAGQTVQNVPALGDLRDSILRPAQQSRKGGRVVLINLRSNRPAE
jgi:hypothetical protein